MVLERALAPATVLRYERLARRFLGERRTPSDDLGVDNLTGAEVAAFLVRECSRLSVGAAKGRVADLRSLLRYLHLRGLTAPLADAVPPVAGWHDTTVPVSVTPSDVEAMLASCDRSTMAGTRDFAIITLLARLGLRSAEVANIEFEDLDWRAGEIVVRGKSRRQDRMPLPSDVGEAVVAYLTRRERDVARRVFLTVRAPRRPILPAVVGEVVERACRRAGLQRAGAHRIRHSLATEMLRRGASLIDVSQVLRHRDLATTAVYAKVDLGRLRQVAQPWPAVGK
jgi:site-specific recombinase XerD